MISERSEFKLIDRGFSDTILLIPGWAADYRIFDSLDLDFNYLLPTSLSPSDFNGTLIENLKKEPLEKISILGWSMGGFLAAEFVSKHPECVKNITLIGMRRKYDEGGIDKIKGYIARNRAGYLYKFYHECFSSEEDRYLSLFKKGLMKNYLKEFAADELLEGLDYLSKARLDLSVLEKTDARFIHGDGDKIAPIEKMSGIEGLTILKGAGHIPFLRDDFKKAFYEEI